MKASLLISVLAILCNMLPAQNGYFPVNKGMKWGLVNGQGELKIPFAYKQIDPAFFGGLVPFSLTHSDKGVGVYNPEIGEILPPVFQSISFEKPTLFEGYFVTLQDGRKGIYDQGGKLILHTELPLVQRVGENSWALGERGQVGIWKDGMEEIADFPYQSVSPLSEILRIITIDDRRYLEKHDGTRCRKQAYQRIEKVNTSWCVGTHEGGADIFDLEGKLLHSLQDTFVHDLSAVHISYKTDIDQNVNLCFGLMDWEKKVITAPDYSEYSFDPQGFIWVKQNNLWGVLDDSSKVVFPPTFSYSSRFGQQVAVVQVGEKLGLINKFGDLLAEPIFNRVQVFEDMARLLREDEKWQQVPFDSLGRKVRRMRLYVAGRKAEQDLEPSLGESQDPQQVYASIGWYYKRGFWGWKSPRTGTFVVKGNIRSIHPILDKGITLVGREFQGGRGRKFVRYGLFDHQRGRWLTKVIFQDVKMEDFAKGDVARVMRSEYVHGLMNRRGQVRLFDKVIKIGPFHHGLAVVTFRNYKTAILKKNGTWAKPKVDAEINRITSFEGGVALFQSKNKWGVMDTLLEAKIPAIYDDLERIKGSDLYLVSQKGQRFSYYDQEGHFIFEKQAIASGVFSEERVWLQNGEEKYAIYDAKGREIVPYELSRASDFQEGLAAVAARGHRWGFIDKQGNWLMDGYEHTLPFAFGLAPAKQKRRYGYLNHEEDWMISPRYRNAFSFQEPGISVVRKRSKYGVIDTTGRRVLKMRYRHIEIRTDHIWTMKGGRVRYYDWEGKRIDVLGTNRQDSTDSVSMQEVHMHLTQLHAGKIKSTSEGIWIYHQDEQFGLLNASGDVIVPVEFDNIGVAEKGKTYTLFRQGRCSYVDENGVWIFKNE